MIATIRDFGLYPCPRCLVRKEDISKIGTEDDRHTREQLKRVDTIERQSRVEQARTNLYKSGYSLTGDNVDGVLKEHSLVPTKVTMMSVHKVHH